MMKSFVHRRGFQFQFTNSGEKGATEVDLGTSCNCGWN